MAQQINRPDTPLAATPAIAPVTSGFQPATQAFAQPMNKYQATADAAIQQISNLSKESMQPVAPAQPAQPTNTQQQ